MLDDEFWDQFESGNEEPENDEYGELGFYPDHDSIEELNAILSDVDINTPTYKLESWKDTILNHDLFRDSIVDLFLEMGSDLSQSELREAGRVMAFNKAYEDIRDLDLNDPKVIEAIVLASDYDFVKSLNMGIQYYEGIEEYEKCAFIYKIQKKGQSIPPKLGSRKEKR
jgi:hypothetical protein